MAIQSMTGFGKGERSNENFEVSVEIKSVNHRFKDIRFKMSSQFSSIELKLRKKLESYFKRGSFDVYVNTKRVQQSSKLDIVDQEKVKAFITGMKALTDSQGVELTVRTCDFLRSEFYLEQDESVQEDLFVLVQEAFEMACEELTASRLSEGEKMKAVIERHLVEYKDHYQTVITNSEKFQAAVIERLEKRFAEYGSELKIDDSRFMQEVIYYLEKLDIHEEINRIEAHLTKFDKILGKGGEMGRQIDFLIQELNRETNTTGSKSTLQEISEAVVQMKVQLEKIREQGLNLE